MDELHTLALDLTWSWDPRIRALFAGVGLPSPRGHRAWTAAGLAGIEARAQPLAECGPSELWRGMLQLVVTEYRSLVERLDRVEAKLDELAQADEGTQLLESIPGGRPAGCSAATSRRSLLFTSSNARSPLRAPTSL